MRKPLEKDDFVFKQGSKIWPSDDPEDSPIDTYVCKHCGYKVHYQGCGSFMPGQMEEEYSSARVRKAQHRIECEKWPMVDTKVTNEHIMERLNIIIDYLEIIAKKGSVF